MLQHSGIAVLAAAHKYSVIHIVTHNKVRHITEETFFRHIG